MKRIMPGLIALVLALLLSPTVHAYMVDIGFSALQAELGGSTPTGGGVRVGHVEAPENGDQLPPIFMPNPSDPQFAGKTIHPVDGAPPYSSHATSVGQLFYGNTSSIAPGITTIDSYEANNWLQTLYGPNGASTSSPERVLNHSWVGGSGDPTVNSKLLRLVDRQAALNESIQVVGLTNGSGTSPLLGGSGYNVISVGRTDGYHQQASVPVPGDSLYGAGRTVPSLVAPLGLTSTATPVVSAAAALLVQQGHANPSLSEGSTTMAGVGTVYNAERSETIKAVLMAGADRSTANTSTTANITDYRRAGFETANGLDSRYGAGQLNVRNSYRIIAGGEQRSFQAGGGDIASHGFDYGSIGGQQANRRTASYFFNAAPQGEVTLFASLVWNLSLPNDGSILGINAQQTGRLYNLNLSLHDVTANRLVASSFSAVDNTENLFFRLIAGSRYEMRVTTDETTGWDYALAWRMDVTAAPVPLPPAAWLFAAGAVSLLRVRRASMPRPVR